MRHFPVPHGVMLKIWFWCRNKACDLNIDRAHPTTPARSRAMGGSPEWWAPHWGKGASQGWAGMCTHGWVWLGDAHGWELEPCSATAVMGQGLTALGAEMGLWALGRVGESPGKAGQGLVVPLGPESSGGILITSLCPVSCHPVPMFLYVTSQLAISQGIINTSSYTEWLLVSAVCTKLQLYFREINKHKANAAPTLMAKPGVGKLVAGGEALEGAPLAPGLAELRLSLQTATTRAAWCCGAARLYGFVLKLFLTKSSIGPRELPLVNLFLKDLLLC